MSQVAPPRQVPAVEGGGDHLRFGDVALVGAGGEPAQAGLTLEIDHRGVVLSGGGAAERALPWHLVTGWQVDGWLPSSAPPGALVTYTTLRATYRFGVPATDPGALRAAVERMAESYVVGYRGTVEAGAATAGPAPATRGLAAAVLRWRPVLVVLLLVVLATMVTLILLQSAGVIDIHWLGGNGSGGVSGLGRHATARPA